MPENRAHAWTSYTIMHGDQKVASIRRDGTCTIYAHRFMPYNLYLEDAEDDIEIRVQNLDNFYYWCASRILTMDREYAKEIMNTQNNDHKGHHAPNPHIGPRFEAHL